MSVATLAFCGAAKKTGDWHHIQMIYLRLEMSSLSLFFLIAQSFFLPHVMREREREKERERKREREREKEKERGKEREREETYLLMMSRIESSLPVFIMMPQMGFMNISNIFFVCVSVPVIDIFGAPSHVS